MPAQRTVAASSSPSGEGGACDACDRAATEIAQLHIDVETFRERFETMQNERDLLALDLKAALSRPVSDPTPLGPDDAILPGRTYRALEDFAGVVAPNGPLRIRRDETTSDPYYVALLQRGGAKIALL